MVERTLAAAREHLGMDVAFVAEFSGNRLAFQLLDGDTDSFGFEQNRQARAPVAYLILSLQVWPGAFTLAMIFAPLGKLRLSERRLFAPHLTTVDPLASFREWRLSVIQYLV